MPRLPALDTIGGGLVTPAGMVIDARGRFKGLGTLATEGARRRFMMLLRVYLRSSKRSF